MSSPTALKEMLSESRRPNWKPHVEMLKDVGQPRKEETPHRRHTLSDHPKDGKRKHGTDTQGTTTTISVTQKMARNHIRQKFTMFH